MYNYYEKKYLKLCSSRELAIEIHIENLIKESKVWRININTYNWITNQLYWKIQHNLGQDPFGTSEN